MLSLSGQRGDWCARTDLGTDWQLIAEPSTTLANWREHTYPAGTSPVTSVAGRTGAITLSKADVGLPNVNNTSDADKPVSTAQHAALDQKASNAALTAAQFIASARRPTPTHSRPPIRTRPSRCPRRRA